MLLLPAGALPEWGVEFALAGNLHGAFRAKHRPSQYVGVEWVSTCSC